MCKKRIKLEYKSREKLVEEYMHGEIDLKTYAKEWHDRFEKDFRTLLDNIFTRG